MDIKRILTHLWKGSFEARLLFPPKSMDAIERTIKECESTHQGEIRFAVESVLDLRLLWRGVTARERAIQVFSDLRIWDTEADNGVLIYLLLADHDVEIVADRGIHKRVGPGGWESICKKMESEFRQGRFLEGVQDGIRSVSVYLETHYPGRGPNENELPDKPVIV